MGLKKRMFLIVIGIALAAGSAWGMFHFAGAMEGKAPVVVASGLIKTAERLTPDNVQIAYLPGKYLLDGAVVSLSEALGKTAAQNIYPGEQILQNKINRDSLSLRKNERCLFIPVKNVFLKPGERVDVYLAYTPGGHPYAGVERVLTGKTVVAARDSLGHEIKNGQADNAGAAESGIEVALTQEETIAYLEKQRYAQCIVVRYGEGGEYR